MIGEIHNDVWWRTYRAPLVLWVVVTAANIAKPFHMDDTAHLLIAEWIARNPFHPMSGPLNWEGIAEPIWHTNQPHLFFYLMAAWGSVFGFSEIAMHALLAIFALLAIILFHTIARYLVPKHADWLSAMLALSPAFIVEQNIMVDIPLLAVWLCFFAALIIGCDDDRQTRRFVLAASACSAAILIKYSSLVLICILGMQLVVERRWRQAWTLAIPIAVVAAWSAFNWVDFGGFHILGRPMVEDPDGRISRVHKAGLAWLTTLGGLIPLGFIILAEWFGRRWIAWTVYLALVIALIATSVAVSLGIIADGAASPWLARLFKMQSIVVLIALSPMIVRATKMGVRHLTYSAQSGSSLTALVLVAWLAATMAFYILLAPFIATRHVLLTLPALLLLLAMSPELRFPRRAKLWGGAMMASISLGLVISDWRWAAGARDEAAAMARFQLPGRQIFASGHWGWQWYARRAGLKQIDVMRSALRQNDIVVAGLDWGHYGFSPDARMVKIRRDVLPGYSWPVLCTMRDVGFYASSRGTPPWTFARDCMPSFDVYVVGKAKAARGSEQRIDRAVL